MLLRAALILLAICGPALADYYRPGSLDQTCTVANEEYTSCGSDCPETCETVMRPEQSRACTMQCVPGCFCRVGFVRNTVNNQCVEPRFCKMPRDILYNKAPTTSATSANNLLILVLTTMLIQNIFFNYLYPKL